MPNKSAINLIQAEIAALNSLLKTIDDSFDNVVDLIVNCSGKIITSGFIDIRSHFRQPGSGRRALKKKLLKN